MSADAMARLRFALDHPFALDGKVTDVRVDDLHAVLDRAALLDEALDALRELHDRLAGTSIEADDAIEASGADAVLAKAGRR